MLMVAGGYGDRVHAVIIQRLAEVLNAFRRSPAQLFDLLDPVSEQPSVGINQVRYFYALQLLESGYVSPTSAVDPNDRHTDGVVRTQQRTQPAAHCK